MIDHCPGAHDGKKSSESASYPRNPRLDPKTKHLLSSAVLFNCRKHLRRTQQGTSHAQIPTVPNLSSLENRAAAGQRGLHSGKNVFHAQPVLAPVLIDSRPTSRKGGLSAQAPRPNPVAQTAGQTCNRLQQVQQRGKEQQAGAIHFRWICRWVLSFPS